VGRRWLTEGHVCFRPDWGNPTVRLIGGEVEPWLGWLILSYPSRRATSLPDHYLWSSPMQTQSSDPGRISRDGRE
jgi:hypothetical protein